DGPDASFHGPETVHRRPGTNTHRHGPFPCGATPECFSQLAPDLRQLGISSPGAGGSRLGNLGNPFAYFPGPVSDHHPGPAFPTVRCREEKPVEIEMENHEGPVADRHAH